MHNLTVFWIVDEHETLVARWMDNGLVFCVSTMPKVGAMIKRSQKRTRVTKLNKRHVNTIWGTKGVADIFIPTLIDDYNHYMGGVGLLDKRISYYHPDLRCFRSWIPVFIQFLSVIRNNMFIIYSEFFKKEAVLHKQFTMQIVGILMAKAHSCAQQTNEQIGNSPRLISTQRRTESGSPKPSSSRLQSEYFRSFRRRKYSDCKHMLYNYTQRKTPPLEAHIRVKSKTGQRGGCVWCALLWKEKKVKGEVVKAWNNDMKRTSMVCLFCTAQCKTMDNVFLYKEHFPAFHKAK